MTNKYEHRILFLEGRSGIGKSTMILEAGASKSHQGAGLFSQRMHNAKGHTVGFRLIPYGDVTCSIGVYEQGMKQMFLQDIGNQRVLDLSVFESARKLIGDYGHASFLVLDEIGGVELQLASFRELLYELLDSGIPCIGVLKAKENYEHMNMHVKDVNQSKESYDKLRKRLVDQYNSRILSLTQDNYEEVKREVLQFFEQI
ncbi:MAG: nucleoside-triphosphatase [Lachnospiraceae bacterium]